MKPLATYQGTWLEGTYRFDIYPESLRVEGSTFLRSDEDSTLALGSLQVRVDKLRIRSQLFGTGLCLTFVPIIAYTLAVAAKLDPLGFPTILLGSPVIGGIALTLASARKTEFARLVTDAGVCAVSIPRTEAADSFDEFITRLLTQIRVCKGLAQPAANM